MQTAILGKRCGPRPKYLLSEDASQAFAKTGSPAFCIAYNSFSTIQMIYISVHEIHRVLMLYHMRFEEREFPELEYLSIAGLHEFTD